MRTLLLTSVAVLVILPMAAAFFLVEKQPAIYEDQALEVAHAERVQYLLKRVAQVTYEQKMMAIEPNQNVCKIFSGALLFNFVGKKKKHLE